MYSCIVLLHEQWTIKLKGGNMKDKIKKQIEGITLIALVITIIVLLILSAIAINLSIGNNGMISETKNTTEA